MIVPDYSTHRGTRYSPASRPPNEPTVDVIQWAALLVLWAVLAAAVLGGFAVLVGFAFLPALGAGTPLVVFLLVVLLATLMSALRRRRAGTVVAYLEQAVRLNLPLPAMLRAAERSEGAQTATALRRVRLELERGMPLSDAVALALPGISGRTLGLIGSAERCGRLPSALERIARESAARFEGRPGAGLYLRWYPAAIAIGVAAVVACVYVFVLPKFFEIFQDFQIALPWQTVLLGQTWDVLAIPLVVVVGAATLLYVGRMLATILAPRFVPRGPVRWAADQIAWRLPGVAGVTRWRALADVCHVIADALEAGHSIDFAITEASRSGTNTALAGRLGKWSQRIRRGEPLADAARAAGLPPMMVGVLRTSAGADLSEMFRFLARYYDGRFGRAAVMLQAALVPGLSVVAGAIVCFIVYSLFVPLIRLIDHLAAAISGM